MKYKNRQKAVTPNTSMAYPLMTCPTLYWYMFIIEAVSMLRLESSMETAGIPKIFAAQTPSTRVS